MRSSLLLILGAAISFSALAVFAQTGAPGGNTGMPGGTGTGFPSQTNPTTGGGMAPAPGAPTDLPMPGAAGGPGGPGFPGGLAGGPGNIPGAPMGTGGGMSGTGGGFGGTGGGFGGAAGGMGGTGGGMGGTGGGMGGTGGGTNIPFGIPDGGITLR